MMKHLMEGMQALEEQELQYARKDHGESFRDFADGYLALAEEVQEAKEDWEKVGVHFHCLLEWYRRDGMVDRYSLSQVEKRALLCACELVQVATVCRKMLESENLSGKA